MNIDSINLHNLSLDTDEECMICKESLNSAQTYKLPECNHIYHTHCITTWFRNGDSRCPYCGNKGINYKKSDNKRSLRWGWRNVKQHECRIQDLKLYAKKNNGPPLLLKHLKKLDEANKILKNRQNELKEFNEKVKTEKMLLSDGKKERYRVRTNRWNAESNINKIKQDIIDLHIVPIIIPTPIDINC
jgi:hypothetical protein